MIRQYRARDGQTIYDICLMTYGNLDNLFKLMTDNRFPGVNAYPVAGSYFNWDDTLIFDNNVNIINATQNVVYSTRASTTGGQYYDIQESGQPSGSPGVPVPPVVPPEAEVGAGYFYVFAGDPKISAGGFGNFVYTDPRLIGLTGYSVYATQLPDFLNDVAPGLTFNPTSGAFTILIPDFYIVAGYRLIVFLNLISV